MADIVALRIKLFIGKFLRADRISLLCVVALLFAACAPRNAAPPPRQPIVPYTSAQIKQFYDLLPVDAKRIEIDRQISFTTRGLYLSSSGSMKVLPEFLPKRMQAWQQKQIEKRRVGDDAPMQSDGPIIINTNDL